MGAQFFLANPIYAYVSVPGTPPQHGGGNALTHVCLFVCLLVGRIIQAGVYGIAVGE